MTMEKDGVKCDGCKNYESMPYTSFPAKRRKLEELGWWTKKIGHKWRHFCSATCVNAGKQPVDTSKYWWNKD